jgi:signal transduction histidine kinase/DNA-binding response OmpR family regulator
MRLLQNISIRRKLTVITMLTTGLALLLACGSFVVYDLLTFRDEMVKELTSMTDIIGANSTAALSFGDQADATGTLSSLRSQPAILGARVIAADGKIFASYVQDPGMHMDLELGKELAGVRFKGDYLELWRPIVLDNKVLGTVYVRSDLSELNHRIHRYVLISLGVILAATLVAFLISFALQRVITEPILSLTHIAQQVSIERNYAIRAKGMGTDEIGQLAEDFNEMLGQIQDRDRKLQASRDHLEEEVGRRTEELRTSNTQLLAARDRAEAANRAKSNFLANMSHEIRTPMTAMIGYADLLLYPDQSPSDRLQCIQTIRRNGEHLLMIINDILDISKIEAGRMNVERLRCSPFQIVSETASLMRVRAIDKDLDFRVEYAGGIPETIHSDPTRLRQVLMNLVSNAIKFTSRGYVRLVVAMADAANAANPKMRFDVIDTGIGMTPEQQAKLFNAFMQADESMTRRFGGTGLGLAISKRLVELLGGEISVQSAPGRGSTFSITIDCGALSGVPMIEHSEEPECGQPATEPARNEWATRIGGHILLAEDGLDNQRLIAFILKNAGADVDLAENGRIAVDKIQEAIDKNNPFDVILMDMQMPEMDGYQASSKLRARGLKTPIIALTAHAMAEDREKCINAGCTDYLTKPIDRQRLLKTINSYLDPSKRPPPEAQPTSPQRAAVKSAYADDAAMREIIDAFVERLPSRVAQIESLIGKQDMDELRRAIHQIKGAGGGYGFGEISKSAEVVERSIKEGASLDRVVQGVCELVELVRSVEGYNPSKEKERVPESVGH